jgi:hypothetical protein
VFRRATSTTSSAKISDENAVVDAYRALPLDAMRLWGKCEEEAKGKKKKKTINDPIEGEYVSEKARERVQRALASSEATCFSLREYARTIVYETECIESKIALTHLAFGKFLRGDIPEEEEEEEDGETTRIEYSFPSRPARPVKPKLVLPFSVPSPKNTPLSSFSAHVLHTVAHIELNAIDLAWDTVARFGGLPREFYLDFARVADDESRHLSWCLQRLEELGHEYGRPRHVVVGVFRKQRG